MDIDKYMIPINYDNHMESQKWTKEIPYIKFPDDWKIKITPPFSGAVIRFQVKKDDFWVSVYLDCYDRLGYMEQPYWEIYPHNEDAFRCYMNETDELLRAIEESFEFQKSTHK
jgi:hypothetical protein